MTDEQTQEQTGSATREITIAGISKKTDKRAEAKEDIRKMAKDTINNFEEILLSDPDSDGDCQLTITTKDPSYDLSAFYQKLTGRGYRIK